MAGTACLLHWLAAHDQQHAVVTVSKQAAVMTVSKQAGSGARWTAAVG
jgi:hypothetical protein